MNDISMQLVDLHDISGDIWALIGGNFARNLRVGPNGVCIITLKWSQTKIKQIFSFNQSTKKQWIGQPPTD